MQTVLRLESIKQAADTICLAGPSDDRRLICSQRDEPDDKALRKYESLYFDHCLHIACLHRRTSLGLRRGRG